MGRSSQFPSGGLRPPPPHEWGGAHSSPPHQWGGHQYDSSRMSTAVRFAERMSRLGTEGAFETLARARRLEAEGKRIVHLEIGEPDFATPDNIVEAGIGAMQNGYTHYTPASGIFEAREAVAAFVTRMLKAEVDPHDPVLVPGPKNFPPFPPLPTTDPRDQL